MLFRSAAEVRAAGAEALSALPGFDAETVAAVLAAAESVPEPAVKPADDTPAAE